MQGLIYYFFVSAKNLSFLMPTHQNQDSRIPLWLLDSIMANIQILEISEYF